MNIFERENNVIGEIRKNYDFESDEMASMLEDYFFLRHLLSDFSVVKKEEADLLAAILTAAHRLKSHLPAHIAKG